VDPSPAYRPVPLAFERLSPEEQRARLDAFRARMLTRRTVRHYSTDPVPDELIDAAITVAGSAPSGANLQPWRFVVVRDSAVKRKIRLAAEAEERAFYHHRAPAEWLEALAPLGTDWRKEFLDAAPCLIVVFRVDYGIQQDEAGHERRLKHYYAGSRSASRAACCWRRSTSPASPP